MRAVIRKKKNEVVPYIFCSTKEVLSKPRLELAVPGLSEKLKEMRLRKGITIAQLSTATGIDFETVNRAFRHWGNNLAIQDLVKIAEYFEVTLDYLLGLDEMDNKIDRFKNLSAEDLEFLELMMYLITRPAEDRARLLRNLREGI